MFYVCNIQNDGASQGELPLGSTTINFETGKVEHSRQATQQPAAHPQPRDAQAQQDETPLGLVTLNFEKE